MSIDQATAARLVKLLALTNSNFDGEALVAMRKANALLKAAGLTWSDIVVVTTAKAEPEPG